MRTRSLVITAGIVVAMAAGREYQLNRALLDDALSTPPATSTPTRSTPAPVPGEPWVIFNDRPSSSHHNGQVEHYVTCHQPSQPDWLREVYITADMAGAPIIDHDGDGDETEDDPLSTGKPCPAGAIRAEGV